MNILLVAIWCLLAFCDRDKMVIALCVCFVVTSQTEHDPLNL